MPTFLATMPHERRPRAIPKHSLDFYLANATKVWRYDGPAEAARKAIAAGKLAPFYEGGKPVEGAEQPRLPLSAHLVPTTKKFVSAWYMIEIEELDGSGRAKRGLYRVIDGFVRRIHDGKFFPLTYDDTTSYLEEDFRHGNLVVLAEDHAKGVRRNPSERPWRRELVIPYAHTSPTEALPKSATTARAREYAGGDGDFALWLSEVDRSVQARLGVSVFDLGDRLLRDAFDAGEDAAAYADEIDPLEE